MFHKLFVFLVVFLLLFGGDIELGIGWILLHKTVRDERDDVVVVRQAAGCRRHAEVTARWKMDVFGACAYLVHGQIRGQAVVVVDSERILQVLYFDANRIRLVAEVAQTRAKLLCYAISVHSYKVCFLVAFQYKLQTPINCQNVPIMIVDLSAIVGHE